MPRKRKKSVGSLAKLVGSLPDLGPPPDAEDQAAVNLWMRQVALRGLAEHAAAGPVSSLVFDAFRRSILALQEEARALAPSEQGETALDEVWRRLKQFL